MWYTLGFENGNKRRITMRFQLLVPLSLVMFIAFSGATARADLVAHWRLDETAGRTAEDSVGGYDGTLKGDPTWEPKGKNNGALAFDGNGDYVQTTLMDVLQTAENFTLSAWFKTNITAQGEPQIIWVGQAPGNGWGPEQELHLSINHPQHHNKLTFYFGSAQDITGQCLNMVSEDDFKDTSEWHHFTAVVSNANGPTVEGKFYLDGQLMKHLEKGVDLTTTNTTKNPPERNAWNTALRIGAPAGDKRYFDGLIDEVAVWDHALTQDEILFLVLAVNPSGKLATTWGDIKQ
jgi:hypothetical protein